MESVDTKGKGCVVTVKTAKGEEKIECDVVLSAVGIAANIENLGLEEVGIVVDKGRILVNDFYQTNIPGYYAIGDVIPTAALAHVASAEGIICVEKIAGHHPAPLDYGNIPGCTYCSPEVASVGMTEKAAKEKAIKEQAAKDKVAREKALLEKSAKDKKAQADEKKRAQEQAQKAKQDKADQAQADAMRQENLQRMQGMAGASGGPNATGTALKSSGPSASYAGRLVGRIKPNITYPGDVVGNPRAEVEVRVAPDGTITSRRIVQSSGNKAWDDAVLRAIDKTEILPKDTDGRVPPLIVLGFRPLD